MLKGNVVSLAASELFRANLFWTAPLLYNAINAQLKQHAFRVKSFKLSQITWFSQGREQTEDFKMQKTLVKMIFNIDYKVALF